MGVDRAGVEETDADERDFRICDPNTMLKDCDIGIWRGEYRRGLGGLDM